MIVASLLLILGAVVLLVLGLVNGASGLLVGSIGTSPACRGLVVGARQASCATAAGLLDEDDDQYDRDDEDELIDRRVGARTVVPPREAERGSWSDESDELCANPSRNELTPTRNAGYPAGQTAVMLPAQAGGGRDDASDDEDPPDEPLPQRISPADAARGPGCRPTCS